MTDTPKLLLAHHLKTLKLPTVLREFDKVAQQCAAEGLDHVQFLARLVELELIDRERRMIERRIKAAKFPAFKSLDSFDFKAIPTLNKERGATLITSNLPFDEWTETFGSERLTGALLDRLTHHVSILEMNGDSYRLGQSRARKTQAAAEARP